MDKKSVKLELFVNTKFVYLPGHFLLVHHNPKQIMQSKELLIYCVATLWTRSHPVTWSNMEPEGFITWSQ